MHKILILFTLFILTSNNFIIQTEAQLFRFIPRFNVPGLHIPGFQRVPHGRQYHRLPLGHRAVGPESVAFDCDGDGPYVGVSDGRVLKWQGSSLGWTVFAVTHPDRSDSCDGLNDSPAEDNCGRPLGLRFDTKTCNLYIADSSVGLVTVGRKGGVATSLSTRAEGIPFHFLNALDIDSDTGDVYFTDSSSRFRRWEFRSIDRNDRTGRLLKYNRKTKHTTVLLKGLSFANGVALSKNKDFVLVAETTFYRIQKYWLTGPKAGTVELFLQLAGRPDNINRNSNGEFWISQNPAKPVKVSEDGVILETLDARSIVDASDVTEINNNLWIGSVIQGYIIHTS
ncbi:protein STRICTOSIDINE SYNTHASE-LIKE 10-like [Spinacia oleracea]|uniref:Protein STRICTOSIDINE SYNTHASE-LIKE 10-like n=1 Tax=Spinacia oleracea TaxID=3562 RepID=A0A9R0IUY5_SPIOL|nr:protein STRICTOSIDINE SYNTHASE-LIKE 10-like [Spinacia oleracea]